MAMVIIDLDASIITLHVQTCDRRLMFRKLLYCTLIIEDE